MIQRGSDTSFTNLWSLLLYLQSLLHYIENAQENKKNTILSYNIAENSKRVKRNEEKVCVCVFSLTYTIIITLLYTHTQNKKNTILAYENKPKVERNKEKVCVVEYVDVVL